MSQLLSTARGWVAEVHPHARHLLRTESWLLEIAPSASEPVRLAAVLHDIERAFPDPDATWDTSRDWDSPEYNRWHQDRCARIAADWLREQGTPPPVVDEVHALVAVHEQGGWPEADLVQAADGLSFLETMVPLVIGWVTARRAPRERAAAKLNHSVDRMSPQMHRARELARPMLEDALAELDHAATGVRR